ncbi:CbtA family protein [Spongisporangium articulatum]|uniref:CbtA family protein n=1 Tax=Spongisporangium articulatum TaxID=3362603 RepID=A0ABW8ARY1_9ACTN
MEKKIIWRGTLCGVVAGLLAFVFARIFAEPQIQKAIDYEEGRGAAQEKLDAAAGLAVHAHEHEVFTRTVQENLGIGVGIVLFGAAMGALFAVTYAYCLGRTGRVRPRQLSLLVAGFAFVGLYLVPFLKYPANPPAIGNDDTSQVRGTLYLVMLLASVAFLIAAVWLGQRLAARYGAWNATLIAGAAYVVVMGAIMVALPSLGELAVNRETFGDFATETPQPLTAPDGTIVFPGFPADVLAAFRLYAVGAQVILWATIGVLFAPMAERLLTPAPPSEAPAEEPLTV